jgi:hypothetical protein
MIVIRFAVIRFAVLPIVGESAYWPSSVGWLSTAGAAVVAGGFAGCCAAATEISAVAAYTASPTGGKVCFALSKPISSKSEPAGRKREPAYIFVATRPAENVKNELSVIIGYSFKSTSDATAEIGTAKFAMYTKNGGAWIKNAADEARIIEAMRKGADLTIKGTSGGSMQSTDQYSLKGLPQALDRAERECR